MAKFLEFKHYGKDSKVLINKNAIISVSRHHLYDASVVRLRYDNEFNVAESVEEIKAKIEGANDD